jgi:4-carboxymuconolactone decarboxylase
MHAPAPTAARIDLPTPERMTPAQRAVYDAVVAGPRGAFVGPLRAVIHNPDLAARWSALGEKLRFDTSLPKRLSELAILVTARRWTSQIEWWAHARAARAAGLPDAIIEAIRIAAPPVLDQPDDALVYAYARALQLTGQVPLTLHRAVAEKFGTAGVVELTALVGYYTMVSMTLNAHEIPLPDGTPPPLEHLVQGGLVELPPAQGEPAS